MDSVQNSKSQIQDLAELGELLPLITNYILYLYIKFMHTYNNKLSGKILGSIY